MAWNKKPRRKESDDKKRDFWATCPDCKKKFTVPAAYDFKYLERVHGYDAEE